MDTPEMISTSGKTIFTSLIKVIIEILIDGIGTFRGLDEDEAHGALLYHAVVTQLFPVYRSLIMTDINTVYLITFGIGDITIKGTPTATEGTDEEIIESENISDDNETTTKPP